MYYLQTRYYVPEWGRFLNADSLMIAGDALTATNMYAYCNGNPVNLVDYSGSLGERIAKVANTIAGGIVGAGAGLITGAKAGYETGGLLGAIGGGAAGAVAGGIAGAVAGAQADSFTEAVQAAGQEGAA